MALVKKKVIEIISIQRSHILGDTTQYFNGPNIVFPFQKLVKIKRVSGHMKTDTAVGNGPAVTQFAFLFTLTDVTGNFMQTLPFTASSVDWEQSIPVFSASPQIGSVEFFDDTFCGGVDLYLYILNGNSNNEGSAVQIYFTFEIEKEVLAEEF